MIFLKYLLPEFPITHHHTANDFFVFVFVFIFVLFFLNPYAFRIPHNPLADWYILKMMAV